MAASNVVTDWVNIASTTIVKNGGNPPASSSVWFAYTSLAAYDAVNAITGEYRPFYYYGSAPQAASVEAAAAAAAHRILVSYFPAQQTDLDARLAASLSALGADPAARDAGVAAGKPPLPRCSPPAWATAWELRCNTRPVRAPASGFRRLPPSRRRPLHGWPKCGRSPWPRRPTSGPTDRRLFPASPGSAITT